MIVKRVLKVTFILFASFVLGFVTLLALLRIDRKTSLILPEPRGPFGVSRLTETWTDEHRADPFVDAPSESLTELAVWIWYPSEKAPDLGAADYLPPEWRHELEARQNLMSSLTKDLSAIHPHSVLDGPISKKQPSYPLVILRGGLGAPVVNYTILAEDLASHGYVVVGFDAPYRTTAVVFPGKRVVTRPSNLDPENLGKEAQDRLMAHLLTAWVSDIGFVLDRLKQLNESTGSRFLGKLDLQKVGIVGHSLGGAAAAQFSHDDSRCVAGIDLDGALSDNVVKEGLRGPFMFLLSDHRGAKDPVDLQIAADIKSVCDRMPPESGMALSIQGANHFSFSDQMLLRNQAVVSVVQRVMGLRLESRRGLEIAAETVHRFLDVHLKGAPASSIHALLKEYPELTPEPR